LNANDGEMIKIQLAKWKNELHLNGELHFKKTEKMIRKWNTSKNDTGCIRAFQAAVANRKASEDAWS
jgi:hypothetical protein